MDFTPEQLAKTNNFKWAEDESGDEPQPEFELADRILECVDKIGGYVVEHLDLRDLQQDIYSITVPIEVHPLLQARFENRWSEDSRSRVFDLVRAVFIQKFAEFGHLGEVARKIKDLLPTTNPHIRISSVDFYDEPEVDVSVTQKMFNITTGEEQVTDHKSYNYCGNTITVEFKIETRMT